MRETLGIFKGVDSNFFVMVDKGIPMIKAQNGTKIGHLHFDDIHTVEAFIQQLEVLKELFVGRNGLSIIEEKRLFGRIN